MTTPAYEGYTDSIESVEIQDTPIPVYWVKKNYVWPYHE
ncbi:MAG: hypothetical protein MAG795_00059 [Candidatus Woesearchaeota archaeon]|nr:hypothetical protein [Candidatus Woesearchaeota archaeon]